MYHDETMIEVEEESLLQNELNEQFKYVHLLSTFFVVQPAID